jgi:hypothetical protein
MTEDQWRSHMGFWCLLAAKLLISVDPAAIVGPALAIVSNPEAIAIDQDPLGSQGFRVLPVFGPAEAARAARDRSLAAAQRAGVEQAIVGPGQRALRFSHAVKYRAGVDPNWAPEFGHLMDLVHGALRVWSFCCVSWWWEWWWWWGGGGTPGLLALAVPCVVFPFSAVPCARVSCRSAAPVRVGCLVVHA